MKDRVYGEGIYSFHFIFYFFNMQTTYVCTSDGISICLLLTLKPVAVCPDGACVLFEGIIGPSVGSAKEKFFCHILSRANILLLLAWILFVFHFLLVHYIFFTASLMSNLYVCNVSQYKSLSLLRKF